MKRIILTEDAPRPVGPYSQGIAQGSMVFVSGQIGIDRGTGRLVEGGIKAETRKCLENLEAILRASGSDLSGVIKTIIFVTDIASFKEVNEVYSSFFQTNPPARSTVGVAALPLGAKVEIEAVAWKD